MATAVPVSVPVVLSPACSSDASSTSTSTAGTNHVTSKKTSAHSPHNNMVTSKAACSLGTTSRSMKANSSSSIGSSSRSAPQTDSGTANATSTSEKGATGSHVSHGFSDNCWTKTKTSHKSNDGSSERESEVSSKEFKLGTTTTNSPSSSNTSTNSTANTNKPSAKTALDALAILASSAHHQLSSNNHNQNQKDDSEIMPPPPPRIKGRLRSASNPEGMEKWDSYSYFRSNPSSNSYDSSQSSSSALTSSLWSAYSGWNDDSSHSYSARRHFVLPSCILEEELAEANETCKIHAEQKQMEQMTHFMDSSSSDTTTHTQGQYGTAPIGYNPVTANAYASANSNSSSRNALQFQPSLKRGMTVFNIEQFVVDPSKKHSLNDNNRNNNVDVDMNLDVYGTSPTTVISPIETNDASKTTNANNTTTSSVQGTKKKKKKKKKPRGGGNGEVATVSKQQEKGSDKNQSYHNNEKKISFMNGEGVGQEENDVMAPLEDEAELDPAELLRRARNKLFEDLSCSENCGMEKGVVPLPHSLDKYKEVYNKNGRIGIYTPAERAAIIAKFNSKRTRRVWNKKIRYNCRKNLADRRMRVKGRFVKRAVEQENAQQQQQSQSMTNTNHTKTDPSSGGSSSSSSSRTSSPLPSAPPSGPLAPVQEDDRVDGDGDVEMPDVNDPEAGFKPTLNQPYRRTRRHTIT